MNITIKKMCVFYGIYYDISYGKCYIMDIMPDIENVFVVYSFGPRKAILLEGHVVACYYFILFGSGENSESD